MLLTGRAVVAACSRRCSRCARSASTERSRIPVRGALQAAVRRPARHAPRLLDDDRITRELAAFPLIRSYTTETVPPGTLAVRIVERQPIGVVESGRRASTRRSAPESSSSRRRAPRGRRRSSSWSRAAIGDKLFLSMTDVLLALPPEMLTRRRRDRGDDEGRRDARPAVGSNQRVVWGSSGTRAAEGDRARLAPARSTAAPARGEYDVSAGPAARCSGADLHDAAGFLATRGEAPRPRGGGTYRGVRNRLARNTLNLN